jgi:hypothetical protein
MDNTFDGVSFAGVSTVDEAAASLLPLLFCLSSAAPTSLSHNEGKLKTLPDCSEWHRNFANILGAFAAQAQFRHSGDDAIFFVLAYGRHFRISLLKYSLRIESCVG